MDIGIKIKQERKDLKLSMRGFAEKLGVSHAHISKLESGDALPSIEMLEKIAKLTNHKVSHYLDTVDNDESLILDGKRLALANKLRRLNDEQLSIIDSVIDQFIK